MSTEISYAIVELMGHRAFGAAVKIADFGKFEFMQCAVLSPHDGSAVTTMLVNPATAVFSITKCTEDEAKRFNCGKVIHTPAGLLDFARFPRTGTYDQASSKDASNGGELSEDATMLRGVGLNPRGLGDEDMWGAFDEEGRLRKVGSSYVEVRKLYADDLHRVDGFARCNDEEKSGRVKFVPIYVAWARRASEEEDGRINVRWNHSTNTATFEDSKNIPF